MVVAGSLEGAVALVTGGTSGIGLAVARALHETGAHVAVCARGDTAVASAEAGSPYRLRAECDVRDPAAIDRTVSLVTAELGPIDVLVNSAGVSMPARMALEEVDPELWDRLLDTNLDGTYHFCRAVLPAMKRRDTGFILNILSTASFAAQPGNSAYSASKYGARALTEGLAEELRETGVRVASINPGPVATNIWSHKQKPPSRDAMDNMLRPEDIAELALFLLTRPRNVDIRSVTITPRAKVIM